MKNMIIFDEWHLSILYLKTYEKDKMDLVARKPVVGVSDQIKLKSVYSATKTS